MTVWYIVKMATQVNSLLVVHSGRLHVHDVGVDHLVPLQHVVRDGHPLTGAIRQAVPRGWLHLHAAHRGDGEVHRQRGVQ